MEPAALVAVALLVVIGVLLLKPWSAFDGGPLAAAPAGASPMSSITPVPSATPPGSGAGPGAAPSSGTAQPSSGPGLDGGEADSAPVDPETWSRISAVLRHVNADGLVFVARWPGGLYWTYRPVRPSAEPGMRLAGDAAGEGESNTVHMTGYLGAPVAIGITRLDDAAEPLTFAWLVRAPGAEARLTLRHPVGDLGRYLWLGPGFGLPRGEQRNRREISRWPPTWPEGAYRFELDTPEGIRYLYVVLEPGASS